MDLVLNGGDLTRNPHPSTIDYWEKNKDVNPENFFIKSFSLLPTGCFQKLAHEKRIACAHPPKLDFWGENQFCSPTEKF